jgi:hypothetical protein
MTTAPDDDWLNVVAARARRAAMPRRADPPPAAPAPEPPAPPPARIPAGPHAPPPSTDWLREAIRRAY